MVGVDDAIDCVSAANIPGAGSRIDRHGRGRLKWRDFPISGIVSINSAWRVSGWGMASCSRIHSSQFVRPAMVH